MSQEKDSANVKRVTKAIVLCRLHKSLNCTDRHGVNDT